jgi:hypothetical protein
MNSVYGKMVKVMGEIGGVEKEGKHQQGYMYATAEDVSNAVRKALVKVGLAFFPAIESVNVEHGRYQVKYNYTFADPDTGDTLTLHWQGEAIVEMTTRDNRIIPDDKALGKCHTYAEKYFFMRTFVVSAGDDPDADTNDPQPRTKPQAKPTPEPFPFPAPANDEPRKELITSDTRKQLSKLVMGYFGEDKYIHAGKLLVRFATKGQTNASMDLSQECAVDLCAMLQSRINEQLAAPKATPALPVTMGVDEGIPAEVVS